MRFRALRLRNHRVFAGDNELRFNQIQTYIYGRPGAGLTTIVHALLSGVNRIGVEVELDGDPELLRLHRQLVLFDGDTIRRIWNRKDSFGISRDVLGDIIESSLEIHSAIMNRIWTIHEVYTASKSEQDCHAVAFMVAARCVLDIDLPLIFDADPNVEGFKQRARDHVTLVESLRCLLADQPHQIIALGYEREHPLFGRAEFELVYDRTVSYIRQSP